MDRTKEFDKLLEKIDRIESVTNHRLEHISKRGEYQKSDIPFLELWNKLKSKHRIEFHNYKTVGMTDQMIGAKEFFQKGEFDRDLFEILQIKVKWSPGYNNLGTMNTLGEMNLRKKKDQAWSFTVAHELGHAWHMQLPKITKLNERQLIIETIKEFLEISENIKLRSNANWNYLKTLVNKHISWYASKSYKEAFGELFAYAYSLKGKNNNKRQSARKAIELFNRRIKIALYNMSI